MALGNMFKKVFVPQNEETHVGTPESPGQEEAPKASEQPQGGIEPEEPAPENPSPETGESPEADGQSQNIEIPTPVPTAETTKEEYHYSAFDEEGESGLWNQHTRIVLAIAVVLFSSMIMWWILI